MKKLLIILLLLITNIAISQHLKTTGNTIGTSDTKVSRTLNTSVGLAPPYQGVTYNARAIAFFDRTKELGIILTDAQKSWYNDSIFVPLLDSGLIGTTRAGDSLACLWALVKFPNGSETVAKLNLLDTAYSLTNVNSVVFTDSGAVGNGTTSYLNTNFTPSLDSIIYKMNSGSIGVYCRTAGTELRDLMAAKDATNYAVILPSNTAIYMGINGGFAINGETHGVGGANKMWIASRRRFQTVMGFANGVITNTGTSNAVALVTTKLYLLARNNNGTANNFSTRQISFAFIGSGLSDTKARALSNILNNSLKGRMYNVY